MLAQGGLDMWENAEEEKVKALRHFTVFVEKISAIKENWPERAKKAWFTIIAMKPLPPPEGFFITAGRRGALVLINGVGLLLLVGWKNFESHFLYTRMKPGYELNPEQALEKIKKFSKMSWTELATVFELINKGKIPILNYPFSDHPTCDVYVEVVLKSLLPKAAS